MSSSRFFLCLIIVVVASFLSRATHVTASKAVKSTDLDNPVLEVTPFHLFKENMLSCARVKIPRRSRLDLERYGYDFRVSLSATEIHESLHSRIQVCFHKHALLGLCECENDEWENLDNGQWSSVMSPFAERYVDVKFDSLIGSAMISLTEEPQEWRLLLLFIGFILLFLSPFVSRCVPFYFIASIAVGASSFGVPQIPDFVQHGLIDSGTNEEMHNPVYIFASVAIISTAIGFWIVGNFVITKEGSVDVRVARFVKWAIWIIATTFISQTAHVTRLALVSLLSYCALCFLIKLLLPCYRRYWKIKALWRAQQHEITNCKLAEVRSRSMGRRCYSTKCSRLNSTVNADFSLDLDKQVSFKEMNTGVNCSVAVYDCSSFVKNSEFDASKLEQVDTLDKKQAAVEGNEKSVSLGQEIVVPFLEVKEIEQPLLKDFNSAKNEPALTSKTQPSMSSLNHKRASKPLAKLSCKVRQRLSCKAMIFTPVREYNKTTSKIISRVVSTCKTFKESKGIDRKKPNPKSANRAQ